VWAWVDVKFTNENSHGRIDVGSRRKMMRYDKCLILFAVIVVLVDSVLSAPFPAILLASEPSEPHGNKRTYENRDRVINSKPVTPAEPPPPLPHTTD